MTEDGFVGTAFTALVDVQEQISLAADAAYAHAYEQLKDHDINRTAYDNLDTAKEAVREAAQMKFTRAGNR